MTFEEWYKEVSNLKKFVSMKFWWIDGQIEENYARNLFINQRTLYHTFGKPYDFRKGLLEMIEWNEGRPWH
jgi:hypothetical protein